MSYSYNRLYETQFRGNNVIPATYGNVSVYTTGKADIGSITTSNLAIGKNSTSNALDVSGNVNINGTLTVSKDVDFRGDYISIFPTLNNPNQNGTLFDANGFVSNGNQIQYVLQANDPTNTGNYFKISAYDGQQSRDYFTATVVNGGVGIGRLTGSITGNLTIEGISTLQGGLTATATQTIDFGTNSITSGTANVSGVKIGAAPYTLGNCIVYPSTEGYRKLVLQPVNNNQFQNYSIGTQSGSMTFLVPDSTRKYIFAQAMSSTTKQDILTIQNTGIVVSGRITAEEGITATTTQTINFGTNPMTCGFATVSGVKIGDTPYTLNNQSVIMFSNAGAYRKLVLHPVYDNEYQNHSIGVLNGETVFLVPETDSYYKFSFATSSTAKTDVLTLGYNGLTLSRGTLTLPNTSISDSALSTNVVLKNASNTFTTLPQSSATPTNSADFTTKTYVDTALSSKPDDNVVVHLTGTETITGQKTFTQAYQDQTLTNPFMRDFSNNGFTVPAFQGAIANMLTTVGAYDTTYSNWRFVSGASATRINYVQWWYGSGTQLEYTQNQIVGAPPTSNPSVFSGNYAIRFESNAPTQSFYTQMGVNLSAGYYTMTFYSFFGSSPFGGGYIGSTSAFVNISVQNSTDTLNYSDPDTRVNGAWKLRTFNFQVVGSNCTYIRWTPYEAVSAQYTFRWALAGISIRKNNGNFFTDASGTALVGGSYSLLQNPVLNNPIAQGTLTCQGTPQFSLKTGASNLVLNTAFNTSDNNVNNVAIGWGLASNPLMTNNTIVGSYGGGKSTSLVDCSIYGYYNSGLNRDTMVGSYLRCVDASYNFNGYNVLMGTYIGIDPGGSRNPTQGASKNCVFIGNEIASGMYNGFGKNPYSPSEAVAIGYRSQNLIWDNSNCSVGPYTLEKADGNNNVDTGQGYLRTTQANSAFGYGAGRTPRNTHCSTYIGMNADFSGNSVETTPVHFSTAIGANAKVRGSYATALGAYVYNDVSNSIRIGRAQDTTQIDGSLNVLKGVNITGDLSVSGSITEGSYPRKGTTVLNNSVAGQKTYTISTSNWTETYALTPSSTATNQMYNITLPTATSATVGAQITISYQPFNISVNNSQYTTINGDMYFPEIQYDATQTTINTFWMGMAGTPQQTNLVFYTIVFTAMANGVGGYIWVATHSNYRDRMANYWPYKQTFGTIPECSSTPTTNSQLANKQYVDSKVAPFSASALLDAANTFSALNIFNTYAPQTDTDPSVANDLVRKSWLDSNFVALSGGQTITGSKTFTKPIVCTDDPISNDDLTRKSWVDTQLATKQASGSYLTTNTAQTVSALKTFTASVKIGSGGYAPPTDCLFIGQHNSYRKIILHSVIDNEFQNYSIGTNVINEEMVFMIPGITRTFKFCNASGTTSKNDLFTLGLNSAATLSVELTLPSMVLSSGGNRYGGWNTTALDLSGSLLQVEQMNVANASTGSITGATTISKPFNQYHAVEATTAFTITLPTITSKEMGKEIVFRKVKQTGTVSVSFIGNGTQKVYGSALTGGTGAQALMTSTTYTIRLVALLDATTGGGVYAWFQV